MAEVTELLTALTQKFHILEKDVRKLKRVGGRRRKASTRIGLLGVGLAQVVRDTPVPTQIQCIHEVGSFHRNVLEAEPSHLNVLRAEPSCLDVLGEERSLLALGVELARLILGGEHVTHHHHL